MKMENQNPKGVDKNYNEERCNFLEGELKRIEDKIKASKYDLKDIKYQKELWALRDNIIKEIGVIPGNITLIEKNYEIENKPKNNKNNTIK
jgi:hypothetical protein